MHSDLYSWGCGVGTCLYKLLKDIMKLASFHDSEGMQLLSILTNRLSSAPTAANNPKQQQQQNGADNKQQAASIQQQQACKHQAAATSKQPRASSSTKHASSEQQQPASSQEPGADEMPAAAAATKQQQQQQVPRRRRVELNPARGGRRHGKIGTMSRGSSQDNICFGSKCNIQHPPIFPVSKRAQ